METDGEYNVLGEISDIVIYVLVGPVGAGKSLMATQRIKDYAEQGRRIAANYHIDFGSAAQRRRSWLSAASCTVLSSKVTAEELNMLGSGGPTEDKAGLLVLDEAGTFLNARTWDAPGREGILKWLRLSRKKHWDVVLIVQVLSSLDKRKRSLNDTLAFVDTMVADRDSVQVAGLARRHGSKASKSSAVFASGIARNSPTR